MIKKLLIILTTFTFLFLLMATKGALASGESCSVDNITFSSSSNSGGSVTVTRKDSSGNNTWNINNSGKYFAQIHSGVNSPCNDTDSVTDSCYSDLVESNDGSSPLTFTWNNLLLPGAYYELSIWESSDGNTKIPANSQCPKNSTGFNVSSSGSTPLPSGANPPPPGTANPDNSDSSNKCGPDGRCCACAYPCFLVAQDQNGSEWSCAQLSQGSSGTPVSYCPIDVVDNSCVKQDDAIPTRIPQCPVGLDANGLCPKITTGFGLDLATNTEGFISSLLAIALTAGGALALLLIIRSGYQLMMSQGNPEKLQVAREELTAAIVGLLFVIFSLVILQTIGVDILHLPGIQK